MSAQYIDRRLRWERHKLYPSGNAAGFRCVHCHQIVPVTWQISGVHNRNHCPYCLYSRHLDLLRAGDRLAACKGSMIPVGLTLKRIPNKYGEKTGELMLVHRCAGCGKLSINRIAADDDSEAILGVLSHPSLQEVEAVGIRPLTLADLGRVRNQLYGKELITD